MTKHDNGYVLLAVLLFMLILSVIGIAANHTSAIEIQIAGNERAFNDDFFKTEGQLIDAIEHYKEWLNDDAFLIAATGEKYTRPVTNDDGKLEFTIEARCITDDSEAIDNLSDYANDVPREAHMGPPLPDFGYSPRLFIAHFFAVTVRSPDDRTILQAGVWKAFRKEKE